MDKTIPNTDGRYSITTDGRVWNTKNGREITPFRPGTVKIKIGGKRTSMPVWRLLEVVRDVEPQIETPEQRFAVLEARLNDTLGEIKKLFNEKR